MRRSITWTLRLGLTALVTWFLFRALRVSAGDLAALEWSRWAPRAWPLVASVVVLLATFLYLVGLWARLVRRLGGGELAFGRAVRVFFLSLLARYVPGKIWQIAGLAYLAGREGIAPGPAAFSAVVAQAFSLGAAAVAGGLYLALGPLPSRGGALLALTVALGVLLLLAWPRLYGVILARVGRTRDPSAARPAAAPCVAPGGLPFSLRWLGLNLVAWAGYGLAFCLLWAAFRPLPASEIGLAATAFPAAYLLGYAAFFAPAGLGVREGALAALTTPALGAADATALAVIARVWMTATELLPLAWMGWVAARSRHRLRKPAEPEGGL